MKGMQERIAELKLENAKFLSEREAARNSNDKLLGRLIVAEKSIRVAKKTLDECAVWEENKTNSDLASSAQEKCVNPDGHKWGILTCFYCSKLRPKGTELYVDGDKKPRGLSSKVVNALPFDVRQYIMWMETDADPAGTLRENYRLAMDNKALRKHITKVETKRQGEELMQAYPSSEQVESSSADQTSKDVKDEALKKFIHTTFGPGWQIESQRYERTENSNKRSDHVARRTERFNISLSLVRKWKLDDTKETTDEQ